jgi:hypothetical protein
MIFMFCYQNWHGIYRKYCNDDNGISSTEQTSLPTVHYNCQITAQSTNQSANALLSKNFVQLLH